MTRHVRSLLACTAIAIAACGEVTTIPVDATVDTPVDTAVDTPIDATPTFTVTVSASGNGTGTVTSAPAGIVCGSDCTEAYDEGTSVTLTATPATGSAFVGWAGDCSGTSTCVVTDDATVVAMFALTNSLVVTVSGTGTGLVTSAPAGIDCGTDCTESYAPNTIVTLTATPNADSVFTGWSGGGCSGTGTCVVTINAATGVNATFAIRTYTLTATRTGTGTGTVSSAPSGISCGADCAEDYAHGTVVTLTAAPAAGSTFTGWGGACSGTGGCTVTMVAAATVTATFTVQQATLTVVRAGTGTGTVTSTPAGINCGADCTEPYNVGTAVTLAATAGAGSVFAGWSGGGCSGTGTCVTTIAAATTVTATFNLQQFTLTVARAGTGTGTVASSPVGISCGADCTELYNAGTVVTLTATPATGSTFTGWSGACTGTGACNVTMNAAATVTATFNLQQFTLSVARNGTGSGTVTSSPAGITCGLDCNEVYNFGTTVTLTAVAGTGSTFAGWTGGSCTGTGTCVVTVTAATTITATFNQVMVQRIGHVTQFAEQSSHGANFLLGEQIVVTQTFTLRQFGILMVAGGPQLVMALYTNNGANQPGNLVAQTPAFTTTAGANEVNPTVANITLTPGTYWIMTLFNTSASVYYTNSASTNTVAYTSLPFGSMLPNPFGTPQVYNGQSFNYYLVVQ